MNHDNQKKPQTDGHSKDRSTGMARPTPKTQDAHSGGAKSAGHDAGHDHDKTAASQGNPGHNQPLK